MDRAHRKELYNRCKPFEFLEPGDPRYIAVDEFGDRAHRVRGENWIDKLAKRIELSNEPVRQLVTGLPGSGKSTELRRLARRLGDPADANLFAVVLDAEDSFDLAAPIDVPDIVLAILHATEDQLLRAEGKDPADAMREGYFKRFWTALTTTEVDLKGGEFAVADTTKLVVELKTRPTLRARVRQAVASRLSQFLDEAGDELRLMQARAETLGRSGIVVIVDSLEKLRGISATWEGVLSSAERVFAGGAPYLRLPVHVLYTVPTALTSRARFERVEFMPMIKLWNRDGSEFQAGFDAVYEIVIKRVPEEDLRSIFGDQLEPRIKRLIEWSGGYLRELMRMLQAAIARHDEAPLGDADFTRVMSEVGDEYDRMITADAFAWLADVAVNKRLTVQNETHRLIAERMLSNNVILRYLNDKQWFALHPAVHALPGVLEAIEKLKAADASGGA